MENKAKHFMSLQNDNIKDTNVVCYNHAQRFKG